MHDKQIPTVFISTSVASPVYSMLREYKDGIRKAILRYYVVRMRFARLTQLLLMLVVALL